MSPARRTVVPTHSASKTRVNALMLGTHIPEPMVMGPRLRGDDGNDAFRGDDGNNEY